MNVIVPKQALKFRWMQFLRKPNAHIPRVHVFFFWNQLPANGLQLDQTVVWTETLQSSCWQRRWAVRGRSSRYVTKMQPSLKTQLQFDLCHTCSDKTHSGFPVFFCFLPLWTQSSVSWHWDTSVPLKPSAWRSPPLLRCCRLWDMVGSEGSGVRRGGPPRPFRCSWGSGAEDRGGTGDTLPGRPPRSAPTRDSRNWTRQIWDKTEPKTPHWNNW